MVAPLVAAAGIGALGAIGGGLLGGSGSHKQNRTNIMLAREQRAWEERMSNTEIQRRVADMNAAGINPLMSVMGMGAASSPSPPMAQVVNEGAPVQRGIEQAAQIATSAAQIKLAEAQARKTSAEAGILESEIPWSASNARFRSETLFSNSLRAAHEVGIAQIEQAAKNKDFQELQPLRIELEKALVAAERLGLSEKEAISELYKQFGNAKGFERIMPIIISLIRGVR